MTKKTFGGELLLLIAAVIWGSAFVAQIMGMDHVGPFTFNAARFTIGGGILLIASLLLDKKHGRPFFSHKEDEPSAAKRNLLLGGLGCGLVLFCAGSLQQIGLLDTTAGKAGFITTLYIVLVPFFGLFLGKRISKTVFIGILFAIPGLYLLSIQKDFSIGKGDLIVFAGTFFWSAHILLIDHFSLKVDTLKMSCLQFLGAAALSWIAAFAMETVALPTMMSSLGPILYAGVFSCCIAYTLQIFGQKTTDPTVASLLLSMESVFAVLSGAYFLQEKMIPREILGCVLMFVAVIITQLPEKKPQKSTAPAK